MAVLPILYAVHAPGQVFALDALTAHAVVGVEQLYRGGEVVVKELAYLRHVRGVADSVLDYFIRNTHEFIDAAANIVIFYGGVEPAHLLYGALAVVNYGLHLGTESGLLRCV